MSYYEFQTTGRYVQYEGALKEFARYACMVGKNLLVLTGSNTVRERLETDILDSMKRPTLQGLNPELTLINTRYAACSSRAKDWDARKAEITCTFLSVRDKILSRTTAKELALFAAENGFDVIVGAGGGKALDFARAIRNFLPVKTILIPTSAATNASVSQSSMIYTEDGARIDAYWKLDTAPELVLVDTALLLQMSPSMLSAGIGDMICTYYEALCNVDKQRGAENYSLLSLEGVRLGIDIMHRAAPAALKALQEQKCNQAFESIVSMILHNCGPFRSICGIGFAHILDEVMLLLNTSRKVMHGLRVGWATIPMLLYQGADHGCVERYIDFCRTIHIPTTVETLGLAGITRSSWYEACDYVVRAGTCIADLPFPVTASELVDSVWAAEEFVSRYVK